VRVCDCEKTTFLHEQDLRSATQARVVKILKVSTVILKNVDIFEITGLNHDGPEWAVRCSWPVHGFNAEQRCLAGVKRHFGVTKTLTNLS